MIWVDLIWFELIPSRLPSSSLETDCLTSNNSWIPSSSSSAAAAACLLASFLLVVVASHRQASHPLTNRQRRIADADADADADVKNCVCMCLCACVCLCVFVCVCVWTMITMMVKRNKDIITVLLFRRNGCCRCRCRCCCCCCGVVRDLIVVDRVGVQKMTSMTNDNTINKRVVSSCRHQLLYIRLATK